MFFKFGRKKDGDKLPERRSNDNVGLLISGNVLLIAVIGALLVIFAFRIDILRSPILLYLVSAAMLLPFLRYSWAKILLITLTTLFGLWFLSKTAAIVTPFILAVVIAYLMHPIVKFIERHIKRIPHMLAVALAFFPIFFAIAGLVALVVPVFVREGSGFLSNLPLYLSSLERFVVSAMNFINATLKSAGLPAYDIDMSPGFLTGWASTSIMHIVDNFFANITRGVGAILLRLLYIIATPIIVFLLLLDFDRFRQFFSRFIPRSYETEIRAFIARTERVVHDYLFGILLSSTIIAIVFFLMFLVTGVRYGLLLSIIRGVFNMVPIVGGFIVIPTFVVAAFSADSVMIVGVIKVAVIYVIGQVLDSWVITPLVLGRQVKLSPVIIILSTILCGYFFNVVGILIAVPMAGVVNLLIRKLQANYLRSRFFRNRER
ncbi:MAG: AI-2E family transporter [Spirochaetota bacterium]